MTHSFVPVDFDAPESIETENFSLAILAPAVSEIDYEAVMSSRVRLRSIFGKNTDWPRDLMTLEDNYKDLQDHESEFKSRKAFAYTVLTNSQTMCIGSVYIDPCKCKKFDSEVYLWVRDDCIHLDNVLYQFISHWVRTYWPFLNVAFPGREISWTNWSKIDAGA